MRPMTESSGQKMIQGTSNAGEFLRGGPLLADFVNLGSVSSSRPNRGIHQNYNSDEESSKYPANKIVKFSNQGIYGIGVLKNPVFLRISKLDLSKNCISSLDGIEALIDLKYLNLTGNRLNSIAEVARIENKKKLETLKILENPFTADPGSSWTLLNMFPSLKLLNSYWVEARILKKVDKVYMKLSQILVPFLTILDHDLLIIETMITEIQAHLSSGQQNSNSEQKLKKFSFSKILQNLYNKGFEDDPSIVRPHLQVSEILARYSSLTRFARECKMVDFHQIFKKTQTRLSLQEKLNKSGSNTALGYQSNPESDTKTQKTAQKVNFNEQTNTLLSIFEILLNKIISIMGAFEGIRFTSGVALTATYEDLFRLVTLSYQAEKDLSLETFLKKRLFLQAEDPLFLENFTNDPVYAFDSLLEGFYDLWPYTRDDFCGEEAVRVLGEQGYRILDLEKLGGFVDEKVVKIKRGYSTEFVAKYYDSKYKDFKSYKDYYSGRSGGISGDGYGSSGRGKGSGPAGGLGDGPLGAGRDGFGGGGIFRSQGKRRVKYYFPVFHLDHEYCRRLFGIVEEKLEVFALAFLDLSEIAKNVQVMSFRSGVESTLNLSGKSLSEFGGLFDSNFSKKSKEAFKPKMTDSGLKSDSQGTEGQLESPSAKKHPPRLSSVRSRSVKELLNRRSEARKSQREKSISAKKKWRETIKEEELKSSMYLKFDESEESVGEAGIGFKGYYEEDEIDDDDFEEIGSDGKQRVEEKSQKSAENRKGVVGRRLEFDGFEDKIGAKKNSSSDDYEVYRQDDAAGAHAEHSLRGQDVELDLTDTAEAAYLDNQNHSQQPYPDQGRGEGGMGDIYYSEYDQSSNQDFSGTQSSLNTNQRHQGYEDHRGGHDNQNLSNLNKNHNYDPNSNRIMTRSSSDLLRGDYYANHPQDFTSPHQDYHNDNQYYYDYNNYHNYPGTPNQAEEENNNNFINLHGQHPSTPPYPHPYPNYPRDSRDTSAYIIDRIYLDMPVIDEKVQMESGSEQTKKTTQSKISGYRTKSSKQSRHSGVSSIGQRSSKFVESNKAVVDEGSSKNTLCEQEDFLIEPYDEESEMRYRESSSGPYGGFGRDSDGRSRRAPEFGGGGGILSGGSPGGMTIEFDLTKEEGQEFSQSGSRMGLSRIGAKEESNRSATVQLLRNHKKEKSSQKKFDQKIEFLKFLDFFEKNILVKKFKKIAFSKIFKKAKILKLGDLLIKWVGLHYSSESNFYTTNAFYRIKDHWKMVKMSRPASRATSADQSISLPPHPPQRHIPSSSNSSQLFQRSPTSPTSRNRPNLEINKKWLPRRVFKKMNSIYINEVGYYFSKFVLKVRTFLWKDFSSKDDHDLIRRFDTFGSKQGQTGAESSGIGAYGAYEGAQNGSDGSGVGRGDPRALMETTPLKSTEQMYYVQKRRDYQSDRTGAPKNGNIFDKPNSAFGRNSDWSRQVSSPQGPSIAEFSQIGGSGSTQNKYNPNSREPNFGVNKVHISNPSSGGDFEVHIEAATLTNPSKKSLFAKKEMIADWAKVDQKREEIIDKEISRRSGGPPETLESQIDHQEFEKLNNSNNFSQRSSKLKNHKKTNSIEKKEKKNSPDDNSSFQNLKIDLSTIQRASNSKSSIIQETPSPLINNFRITDTEIRNEAERLRAKQEELEKLKNELIHQTDKCVQTSIQSKKMLKSSKRGSKQHSRASEKVLKGLDSSKNENKQKSSSGDPVTSLSSEQQRAVIRSSIQRGVYEDSSSGVQSPHQVLIFGPGGEIGSFSSIRVNYQKDTPQMSIITTKSINDHNKSSQNPQKRLYMPESPKNQNSHKIIDFTRKSSRNEASGDNELTVNHEIGSFDVDYLAEESLEQNMIFGSNGERINNTERSEHSRSHQSHHHSTEGPSNSTSGERAEINPKTSLLLKTHKYNHSNGSEDDSEESEHPRSYYTGHSSHLGQKYYQDANEPKKAYFDRNENREWFDDNNRLQHSPDGSNGAEFVSGDDQSPETESQKMRRYKEYFLRNSKEGLQSEAGRSAASILQRSDANFEQEKINFFDPKIDKKQDNGYKTELEFDHEEVDKENKINYSNFEQETQKYGGFRDRGFYQQNLLNFGVNESSHDQKAFFRGKEIKSRQGQQFEKKKSGSKNFRRRRSRAHHEPYDILSGMERPSESAKSQNQALGKLFDKKSRRKSKSGSRRKNRRKSLSVIKISSLINKRHPRKASNHPKKENKRKIKKSKSRRKRPGKSSPSPIRQHQKLNLVDRRQSRPKNKQRKPLAPKSTKNQNRLLGSRKQSREFFRPRSKSVSRHHTALNSRVHSKSKSASKSRKSTKIYKKIQKVEKIAKNSKKNKKRAKKFLKENLRKLRSKSGSRSRSRSRPRVTPLAFGCMDTLLKAKINLKQLNKHLRRISQPDLIKKHKLASPSLPGVRESLPGTKAFISHRNTRKFSGNRLSSELIKKPKESNFERRKGERLKKIVELVEKYSPIGSRSNSKKLKKSRLKRARRESKQTLGVAGRRSSMVQDEFSTKNGKKSKFPDFEARREGRSISRQRVDRDDREGPLEQNRQTFNPKSSSRAELDQIKKFNHFMANHDHKGAFCEACRLFMLENRIDRHNHHHHAHKD